MNNNKVFGGILCLLLVTVSVLVALPQVAHAGQQSCIPETGVISNDEDTATSYYGNDYTVFYLNVNRMSGIKASCAYYEYIEAYVTAGSDVSWESANQGDMEMVIYSPSTLTIHTHSWTTDDGETYQLWSGGNDYNLVAYHLNAMGTGEPGNMGFYFISHEIASQYYDDDVTIDMYTWSHSVNQNKKTLTLIHA